MLSFGAFGGQAALLLTACLFMLASALPFSFTSGAFAQPCAISSGTSRYAPSFS